MAEIKNRAWYCGLKTIWGDTYCCIKTQFAFIATCVFGFAAVIMIIFGFWPHEHEVFSAASGLFAAAAITYTAHRFTAEHRINESRFYLKKYIQTSRMILNI